MPASKLTAVFEGVARIVRPRAGTATLRAAFSAAGHNAVRKATGTATLSTDYEAAGTATIP